MSTPPPSQHRPGATGLVARRPVLWFFVLAFGLSWLAWSPFVLGTSGLGLVDLQLPVVLGSAQLVGVLPGAFLGPLTAAFVVTAAAEGRPGLRAWRRRLTHWRVGWRWYVGVVLAVVAAILLATAVLPGALSGARLPGAVVLVVFVPLLVVQFLTSAAAEEPGWRDFALPRLQDRHGPVLGTTVLGVLWGCWHLPLFLTAEWGGYPELTWTGPVEFVASCVSLSMVMTWVFNRTGQGLPLVMVLHAAVNTTVQSVWLDVFPALDQRTAGGHAILIATTAAAVVVLVRTRGRLGLDAVPAHAGPAAADRTVEPLHSA